MLAQSHLVPLIIFVVSRTVAMKRCSVVDQLASAGVLTKMVTNLRDSRLEDL